MAQYRQAAAAADHPAASAEQTERLRQQKIAHGFYRLRRDLQQRAELHALDTGADQKLSPMEMSRRAAARAGLQLPKTTTTTTVDDMQG